MDTTKAHAGDIATKKKAAFSRGLLELSRHRRCPVCTFLAASVRLRRGFRNSRCRYGASRAAGLAAPVAAGAGTPAWHVVKSTTALVMSTASSRTTNWPSGPLLRCVNNQCRSHSPTEYFTIIRSHLLQDAAEDLLPLVAELLLCILHGRDRITSACFRSAFSGCERVFVQLALLRGHLLLQASSSSFWLFSSVCLGGRISSAKHRDRGGLRCCRRWLLQC